MHAACCHELRLWPSLPVAHLATKLISQYSTQWTLGVVLVVVGQSLDRTMLIPLRKAIFGKDKSLNLRCKRQFLYHSCTTDDDESYHSTVMALGTTLLFFAGMGSSGTVALETRIAHDMKVPCSFVAKGYPQHLVFISASTNLQTLPAQQCQGMLVAVLVFWHYELFMF